MVIYLLYKPELCSKLESKLLSWIKCYHYDPVAYCQMLIYSMLFSIIFSVSSELIGSKLVQKREPKKKRKMELAVVITGRSLQTCCRDKRSHEIWVSQWKNEGRKAELIVRLSFIDPDRKCSANRLIALHRIKTKKWNEHGNRSRIKCRYRMISSAFHCNRVSVFLGCICDLS